MTRRWATALLVGAVAGVSGAVGGAVPLFASTATSSAEGSRLEVPVIPQKRERCGPAALEMVLRYYGADSAAALEAQRAYDPKLRGALITDLAAAARRAGYEAAIATIQSDSLIALLDAGVPPIVLFQNGRGPLTLQHYAVVTAWDAERATFEMNDGGKKPRSIGRGDLEHRWSKAGSQALIVRRGAP